MDSQVRVTAIFKCSLERAFKSPMLCDVVKVHTGFGLMPKVTHCTDDGEWGNPGSTKRIHVSKSMMQAGGYASLDRVIERVENQYWKIEVSDFQTWMLGFSRFTGVWKTTEIEANTIRVDYSYTLHSDVAILQPLNWLFAHLFWKTYMKRVVEKVRQLAYTEDPYLYD